MLLRLLLVNLFVATTTSSNNTVVVFDDADLEAAAAKFGDYIKSEVLGNSISFAEIVEGEELSFDEIESSLVIVKA